MPNGLENITLTTFERELNKNDKKYKLLNFAGTNYNNNEARRPAVATLYQQQQHQQQHHSQSGRLPKQL